MATNEQDEELDWILEQVYGRTLHLKKPKAKAALQAWRDQHTKEAVEAAKIEWLDDQIRHVLFDIYPEDVFTPPTKEDYERMNELDPNLNTRLHCAGIRHGLHILRREARGLSAREDLAELAAPTASPQQPKPLEERKDGDASS